MNIAKHKEILGLREELHSLETEYLAKQNDFVDAATDRMLSAAVKEFIDYVKGEGFEVDGDENGVLKAILEGIVIRLERKSSMIRVNMPNGESYSIYIETTLEYSKDYKAPGGLTQDGEINKLKQSIEKVKEQFGLIDSQQFRYILSTEDYLFGRINYSRRPFLSFNDILVEMFN